MQMSSLLEKLTLRETSLSLAHILENAKAGSGGERDVNFLRFLLRNDLLVCREASLKRTRLDQPEEYYLERYKKMNFESDRHFLCRTILQEEFTKRGFASYSGMDIGDMQILRENSNYDIVTEDFQCLIDVGLAPARNFFRGLTDLRTRDYMITAVFDDYMDDVLFSVFTRTADQDFLDAVRDYEEGFKPYMAIPQDSHLSRETP